MKLRLSSFLPENIKVGKFTDIALSNKLLKAKGQYPEELNKFTKSLDEMVDKFSEKYEKEDENLLMQLLNSDKIKVKIFSYIPFITKVRVKFTHVADDGRKTIDTFKFRLKDFAKKPAEIVSNVFDKFFEFGLKVIEKFKTAVD